MNTLLAPTTLPSVQDISPAGDPARLSSLLSQPPSVALGRREVHGGRAKFGIFGDGKEVAQVALAHAFRPGDWRVGYYRGQTLMLALGLLTPSTYFAQLYGHTDVDADPNSGGRAMLGHFGSRILDTDGRFLPQTDRFNSSADLSPTAGQMPRLVGLALASRMYRELPELQAMGVAEFSHLGDEVVFAAIGNASCAEGFFWESLNAIGVLRAPAVISIWDDGYGISVPNEYQSNGRQPLGLAARLSAAQRRRARFRHLYRARLGLSPACSTPISVRPNGRRTGSCAGRRARGADDPAAGPFHLGQPRALQAARTAGL